MAHFFLVKGEEEKEEKRRECLVICLSHALYDGVSLPALLRDLDKFYTNGSNGDIVPFSTVPSAPFSHYVARAHAEPARSEALAYWKTLLAGSSLSVLPGQTTTAGGKGIFHSNPVPLPSSSPNGNGRFTVNGTIKEENNDIPVATTATVLTAAWALVLARRLRRPDVTFGSVTSGRTAEAVTVPVTTGGQGQEGDETVVVSGPCYQLSPVRVPFGRDWTATDLLAYVQRQAAESSAHDFVGFTAVAEAVGWTGSSSSSWTHNINITNLGGDGNKPVFFDSVVHHQDWEDFDNMPFGGRRCAVDILNPHGDAPWPLKVVSFVQEGRLHVGIVGSEQDAALVDDLLAQLTDAAQQLLARGEELLLTEDIFAKE
ncbi:hypothetical protein VTH82DRAFT_4011 [Thermothelomyces myriococcoides]